MVFLVCYFGKDSSRLTFFLMMHLLVGLCCWLSFRTSKHTDDGKKWQRHDELIIHLHSLQKSLYVEKRTQLETNINFLNT